MRNTTKKKCGRLRGLVLILILTSYLPVGGDGPFSVPTLVSPAAASANGP